jgi:protoporphyrinogen oxidase
LGARVSRWDQALPHYSLDWEKELSQAKELMKKHPRWHLLGNAYGRLGLSGLLNAATELAWQLTEETSVKP